MAPEQEETPKCLRCKRGPSYHGGRDPQCIFHGCESRDLKELGTFARQKKIDTAVQQALSKGETTSDPTATATTSKATPQSSPPGVRPSAMDVGPQSPCQRCLRCEKHHQRHNPLAVKIVSSSELRTSLRRPPPPEFRGKKSRQQGISPQVQDDADSEDLVLAEDPLRRLFGTPSTAKKSSPPRRTPTSKPQEPECNLPPPIRPAQPKRGGIVRGISLLEAGAARAIPAPPALTRQKQFPLCAQADLPEARRGQPLPDPGEPQLPQQQLAREEAARSGTVTKHTVATDSHDPYASTAPDEPAGEDADRNGEDPDHNTLPTSTNAEAGDKGNNPHSEPSETSVWTLLEPLPPEHSRHQGLHPDTDVFEDGACENRDAPMPWRPDGGANSESCKDLGDDDRSLATTKRQLEMRRAKTAMCLWTTRPG